MYIHFENPTFIESYIFSLVVLQTRKEQTLCRSK